MPLSQLSALSAIVADLHGAGDRDELKSRLQSGLLVLGFDGFTMSFNAKDKYELALAPTLTCFPAAMLKDYEALGLCETDPVLLKGVAARAPFLWNSATDHARAKGRHVAEYFGQMPRLQGLVVPLPRAAGRVSAANIGASLGAAIDADTVHCVSIIVRTVMMKAEALGLHADDSQARLVDANLSPRQIEVLGWAAQGKSNTDIAAITGLSKRMVDHHVSEILRKLKVSSRTQAVALATRRH